MTTNNYGDYGGNYGIYDGDYGVTFKTLLSVDSNKPWSHFVKTHSTKMICLHGLVFRYTTIEPVLFWKEEKLLHFSLKTLKRHLRN